MTTRHRALIALFAGLLVAAAGIAQQADDDSETAGQTSEAEQSEAPDAPTEDDALAAEDAVVDEILSDPDLVYEEDEDSEDFIPSQQVSADQSLDYPIDI